MAPSSKRSRFVKSISKVRETQTKKQDILKTKIKAESNTARSNASSNKRVALQALKRKKQQQHNGTDFASHNDMEDIDQIFLSAMDTAAKAMKAVHKDMDVEKVHALMEDIAEQNEIAKKIAEAVSNPIGFGNDIIDKADLEAELAALQEEIINEKLITVGSTSTDTLGTQLPEAPKNIIPVCQNKKKEDDDIAELESWATS